MATESKYPDGLTTQANLSGAVTDVDDDPDSPDGLWLTASSDNADSNAVVTFPTPTGNPNVGAGLQQFRVWARLTANGTACTYNVYLANSTGRLNGGTAIATGSLTSTSGQLITANWNASLLSTADGSDVRCDFEVIKSGGSPANRTTGEVGAFEWVVDYSTSSPQTITGSAYSDPDSFGAGTVSTSYTITGAAYTDPDSFGAGTVTPGPVTITGVAYSDPDSFGAGTVSTSYAITGAAFADPDSFGAGHLTQSYYLGSNSDGNNSPYTFSGITFPGGRIAVGVFIMGPAGSGPISSLTVNGVTASKQYEVSTGSNASVVAVYDAVVTAGTGSIVVNWTGSAAIRCIVGYWPVGDASFVSGAQSTADPSDVSQNTQAGDTAILFGASDAGTATWTSSGATENFELAVDVSRTAVGALNRSATGATPESFSLDPTGATGNIWSLSAVYRVTNAQTITGSAFTDADSFGSGTVTTSYAITGAAFSDPDSFGSGAVTASYTITGAALVDADSFGSGTVTTSYQITGAAFADPDSFGAGTVSTSYQITGASFADADTFGAGSISTSYQIVGAAYTDPDSFGAGVVTLEGGPQTITGAAFVDPDAVGAGAVTPGAVTITGAAYTDPDAFGSGVVQASYTITGASYVDADAFGAGVVTTAVTITGAAYVDPDNFGSGVITLGGGAQVITGAMFADPDSFGFGTITPGAVTITGATYVDADLFGSGVVILGGLSARRVATAANSQSGGTFTSANGGTLARAANGGTISRG